MSGPTIVLSGEGQPTLDLDVVVSITQGEGGGGEVSAHLADATDAHDASAISFVATGSIAATNVQTAVAEVATDAAAALTAGLATKADASALTAHTGDTSDAHDASAISFVAAGTIAATDVQAAIEEVATDAASALTSGLAGKSDTSHSHSNAVASGASGYMTGADKAKLDGIEAGATSDQSAAEILALLVTVDGAGSGLDADLLDGQSSAAFATAASLTSHTGNTSNPHSVTAVQVGAAPESLAVSTVTASRSLTANDRNAWLDCDTDTAGGNITLTVPASTLATGAVVNVSKKGTGGNVLFAGSGGLTIRGSTTLSDQNKAAAIIALSSTSAIVVGAVS